MSLLKIYASLPLIPTALNLTTLPFRFIKYKAFAKLGVWDPTQPMRNFERLSNAKPSELKGRVCPLDIYDLTPWLHHGTLGANNPQEAKDLLNLLNESISLLVGLGVASIPVLKFFGKCLKTNGGGIGLCTKTTLQDLFSYSGVPLLLGAYVISRFVKQLFVTPTIGIVSQDPYQFLRLSHLELQYKAILAGLNEILNRPITDPQFEATAKLAIRFLMLHPHIEKELSNLLALKKEDVQKILSPIQSACRQIVAKQRGSLAL